MSRCIYFPIENGAFPACYVSLPEGFSPFHKGFHGAFGGWTEGSFPKNAGRQVEGRKPVHATFWERWNRVLRIKGRVHTVALCIHISRIIYTCITYIYSIYIPALHILHIPVSDISRIPVSDISRIGSYYIVSIPFPKYNSPFGRIQTPFSSLTSFGSPLSTLWLLHAEVLKVHLGGTSYTSLFTYMYSIHGAHHSTFICTSIWDKISCHPMIWIWASSKKKVYVILNFRGWPKYYCLVHDA